MAVLFVVGLFFYGSYTGVGSGFFMPDSIRQNDCCLTAVVIKPRKWSRYQSAKRMHASFNRALMA